MNICYFKKNDFWCIIDSLWMIVMNIKSMGLYYGATSREFIFLIWIKSKSISGYKIGSIGYNMFIQGIIVWSRYEI